MPNCPRRRCTLASHLQAAEFLYETRLFPERAYTFKHALTHEVAYGSLLQERRQALHAKIVDALETLAGDRRDEQVDRLAQHALRGQVWDKALRYCQQAGPGRVPGLPTGKPWGAGNRRWRPWPTSRQTTTLEQAIDLRCELYTVLSPLAQFEQLLTYLRAAETLAVGLGDQRRLGYVYRQMAVGLRLMQDFEPALAYCKRGQVIATALEISTCLFWSIKRWASSTSSWESIVRLWMLAAEPDRTPRGAGHQYLATGAPSVLTHTWMVRCLIDLGNLPME